MVLGISFIIHNGCSDLISDTHWPPFSTCSFGWLPLCPICSATGSARTLRPVLSWSSLCSLSTFGLLRWEVNNRPTSQILPLLSPLNLPSCAFYYTSTTFSLCCLRMWLAGCWWGCAGGIRLTRMERACGCLRPRKWDTIIIECAFDAQWIYKII